jgi:hypothetical protein
MQKGNRDAPRKNGTSARMKLVAAKNHVIEQAGSKHSGAASHHSDFRENRFSDVKIVMMSKSELARILRTVELVDTSLTFIVNGTDIIE